MSYNPNTKATVVVDGPDGRRWIRPDNDCYSCNVTGPNCLWHKDIWVLEQNEIAEGDESGQA
jgi:hypothetical protein